MAITINGNGTITGYTPVPDGSITSAKLASGVGGKILQVQSTTKTDTHSSTDNKADIPGTDQNGNGSVWCVKITPSATTSKILVQAMVTGTHDSIHGGLWLQRDGSDIAKSTYANGQLATTKTGYKSWN